MALAVLLYFLHGAWDVGALFDLIVFGFGFGFL